MAFERIARTARNGLRRSSTGASTRNSEKDKLCEGAPTRKYCSLPSLERDTRISNFSYLSSIPKVNHNSFWSRGITVAPSYQFPSAERIVEESDLEYNDPKYPGLEATKPGEKPRVVVLGTGWAACRFLKGLDTKVYDVVCISPRNHMVFTPLLASTCVGTLEFRSVAEPVSRIQSALATSPNSYFYMASCINLDTDKHEVRILSNNLFSFCLQKMYLSTIIIFWLYMVQ